MQITTIRHLVIAIIAALFVTTVLAVEPENATVTLDADLVLPSIADGTGPGSPVCIDETGLLVAGCDSVQAPISGTCPVGEFVVGINTDGSLQCASLEIDCLPELVCPDPASGRSCISGRLWGIKSGSPLRANMTTTSACSGGAQGGPCDLVLEVYDALAFAQNPAGAVPLVSSDFLVDGCGRYRFTDIVPPALGYIAVTVSDKVNDYELSARFLPLAANETIPELNAWAVEASTVQMWTDSAGSPFGSDTFADRGVLFAKFSKDGVPVPGVTATVDGSVNAADDYYFSDGYPSAHTTINPSQSSTGTNGAAVIVDSDFVSHSGQGGEDGCSWTEELADAIPGVVTVAEFACN